MSQQYPLITMTADIVSAYVTKNQVRPAELPDLLHAVHGSLQALGDAKPLEDPVPGLKPAVSIKKSITDDYIISLEDGRKFKSMKRYLAGLGMTPADYRAKWGLPTTYPMVAPGYAARRSELARAAGLGRKANNPAPPAAPAPSNDDTDWEAAAPKPLADAPKRRGRPKKAA